jgi:hypothetical protein
MNIYRLDPIDAAHPSWQYSREKETLWAGAPAPHDARDLVAAKTGFAINSATERRSPWQNEDVTSCIREPSMTHILAGTVVRADGSHVGD